MIAIKSIEHIDGKMIMQGSENGRGWTIVISEKTGKMSATISDDQVGFVVFRRQHNVLYMRKDGFTKRRN